MIHLEEARKQHDKYEAIFRDNEDETVSLDRKVVEMKKQLTESMTRERELSRKVSLLEQSTYQHSD